MSRSISRYFQGRWSGILVRCRDLHCESGQALVELAVVLVFFIPPLLLGTADVATLVYGSIEVSNAAHAGAVYGMTSSNLASDTANIQAAAQNEASDFGGGSGVFSAALTVTPTAYWACSANQGGTQYTGVNGKANAATACTGTGNYPLEFIQVVVSAPVTLPFHCCGLPATTTLSGTSVMEVY